MKKLCSILFALCLLAAVAIGFALPADAAETIASDETVVVIYNPSSGKALSSNPSHDGSYYLGGVDVTVNGSTVTGFGATEQWNLIDNGNGTYSFSYNGKNLAMGAERSSTPLGEVNDDWKVIDAGNGLYYIENTVRTGNRLQWRAETYNYFSCYYKDNTGDSYQFAFYVVSGSLPFGDNTEPDVTEPTITEPEMTAFSGTCGDNVTWVLDDTGTLTISGIGTMADYVFITDSPWYYHRDAIIKIVISNGVSNIGAFSFDNCGSLTSVTISNSVTTIDNCAFRECNNLTSVTIPNSVTTIGNNAFAWCSSLASITIPNSVTSIGDYAFYNCKSLQAITIGSGVTRIGTSAFDDCIKLRHIAYTGTESQWNQIYFASWSSALLYNSTRHYETAFVYQNNCEGEGLYCPVCKDYLIRTENGNGGHNYSDWFIIKPATFTAAGQKEQTCATCGDTVTETIPMLVGKVSQWNVSLENDFAVNFYMEISESVADTARVRIYVGEEGQTFRVSQLKKTDDGLYVASIHIAAAQMSDYIFVTVLNENDIGTTVSYTVRQYANTILMDERYVTYHDLVKEMLNYGAAAQGYFDYETDRLANEGITNAGNVDIPNTLDGDPVISGAADGVNFYGASLVFRNKVSVRYYFRFTGDISAYTFQVNGVSYQPKLSNGLYYVEVMDILPQDLDKVMTLTATDAQSDTLSVSYSPMNYIVRMSQKGSVELQNLLKALYNYHLAAKAFHCGHNWIPATCSTPKTCSICGVSVGSANGHNYSNGVCTVCGDVYRTLESGVWRLFKYQDGHLYDVEFKFSVQDESSGHFSMGIGDDITDEKDEWLSAGPGIAEYIVEWEGRYYYFGSGDGGDIVFTVTGNMINIDVVDYGDKIVLERISGNELVVVSFYRDYGLVPGDILTWSAE